MLLPNRQLAYASLVFLLTSVCIPGLADDVTKYPVFSPDLLDGRDIWLANCETCHAYGTAGAPNPLIPSQWEQRLKTPLPVLYQHAIDGFYGESDTYMPARGGNPNLSDQQVQSAVNYMLALAQFTLDTKAK